MRRALFVWSILVFLFAVSAGEYYTNTMLYCRADNTNHGWEVKRNNNHMQPEIPSGARNAITKYNGIYAGDPGKKVIYMTIDLGYESGNTSAILDVLRDNGAAATFFIVQPYMEKNPELVDRIVSEGHSLQNHTARYKHLDRLDDDSIKKEIMGLHQIVKDKYGFHMKYLRPPYEEWSERVLKITGQLGYKSVFWSIACVDWVEGADADYIYNHVMDNYHNGAIILMHAVSKSSPRALQRIITRLKSMGFQFRTLDL